MKKLLTMVLLFALVSGVSMFAQDTAATDPAPVKCCVDQARCCGQKSLNTAAETNKLPAPILENISKTMEFIKKGQYEEALKETASDGPLAQMFAKNAESYNNIVNNLKKVPEMYGQFQDYSIIQVRDLDQRIYRILLLYYTDTLPLKFDLVYYHTKGKWVNLYFFFNDEVVNLFDELYR